jgi:hypothetical protein
VAIVLPLADGVNMDRVVQKGTPARKFLLQDWDPCVQADEPEATATVLNSCPTPGNPDDTTVLVRSLCNGWSRSRQRKILAKTARYLASPGIAWLRRNKDRYT